MTARRHLEWSEGAAGPVLAALASDVSTDWRDYSACAETDPEAFFPPNGESGRPARKICAQCFVRAECLEYALTHEVEFGIWGGLSTRQRQRILRGREVQAS